MANLISDITSSGEPYFSSTTLLLPFDGTNGATAAQDLSNTNNNPVQFFGDAQISTAQSKFGGSSLSLSGAGRAGLPDVADYNLGSNDFTIECFVYPTSYTGNTTNVISPLSQWTDVNRSWVIYILSSTELRFAYSTTGSDQVNVSASATVPLNEWSHIAVVRNNDTILIFLNGAQVGTGNIGTTSLANSTTSLWVGTTSSGTYANFVGYIDEVRISNGIARYTGNFTPPTQAFPTSGKTQSNLLVKNKPNITQQGDQYFANTTLLLPFDGSNGDTTTTDLSSLQGPVTFYNSAQLSTGQFKNGPSSLYLPSVSSYIQAGTSDTINFNTGNFTHEFWMKMGSQSDNFPHLMSTDVYNGPSGWYMTVGAGSFTPAGSVIWVISSNIANPPVDRGLVSTSNVLDDQWHHVAIVRNNANSTIKMFVDGILEDTITDVPSALSLAGGPLKVGTAYIDTNDGVTGYIDDLRITKGVARYTENFTPPTEAFPTSGPIFASSIRNLLMQITTPFSPPALWDPSQTTTVIWYDAADASTITETSNLVSQWDDKSGNGNHATTAGGDPTTNTVTINGVNALRIEVDRLSFTEIDFIDKMLIIVASKDINSTYGMVLAHSTVNNQIRYQVDGTIAYAALSNPWLGGAGEVKSTGTITGGQTYILAWDGGATGRFFFNGVQDASTYTRSNSNPYVVNQIGVRYLSSDYFVGNIGEILVVPSSITDGDRQKIEGYLAHKWGLTADLDGSHPYKLTAPTV